jgi:hypothetical protein
MTYVLGLARIVARLFLAAAFVDLAVRYIYRVPA